MNALKKLALGLIVPAVIIAFVPDVATKGKKITPESLLLQIKSGSHYISPEEIADKIVKKDPSFLLVDVRSPKDFVQFNLPGSLNIPLQQILFKKHSDVFDQDSRIVVLYSYGNTDAVQAWMLLQQEGKQNIYVLQGGLNYWAETIMNPKEPGAGSPDDEVARYNFRKAAGMALGGATIVAGSNSAKSKSAGVKNFAPKKKKGASGGC